MAVTDFPARLIKRRVAASVVRFFNDETRGQRPIVPSANALIPADSPAWRVHGDVTGMMAGGIAALLLQMLHPGALAGVWDHSDFRRSLHGRLRNTARFIAATTYGDRSEGLAAIARVRRIHAEVAGTLPDGCAYRADDPHLLAWVHVAGSAMFLAGWQRFGSVRLGDAERDRYWADVAPIAQLLGADPVPTDDRQAQALIMDFRGELRADERTRAIRDIILDPPGTRVRDRPVQRLLSRAAIDLLPPWARGLHGLSDSGLASPAVEGATLGLAATLRWALGPRQIPA